MIRIAADHITPRLLYACREFFGEHHQVIPTEHTTASEIDIWYATSSAPEGVMHIIPSGLLSQESFSRVQVPFGKIGEMPVIFSYGLNKTKFDVLSAVFYLLSRYEEYDADANAFDKMGRFKAESSILWKLGCLEIPIIEVWRNYILKEIGKASESPNTFEISSTIDVDSAYAYRHKGIYRTLGGIGKDIIRLKFSNLIKRLLALCYILPDPYDTYQWIDDLNQKHRIPLQWFFLLADFGKYDKGLPHSSSRLQRLVRQADGKNPVGIHPGVNSNSDIEILRTEIGRMVSITRRPCVHARQHYLVLSFPLTYQRYLTCGIRHDHSMGYAEHPGFRAGTSRPFHWYDLSNETTTDLVIHPFACMDTSLNKYMNLTPEQATERVRSLIDNTHANGGHFSSLWHNETLSEQGIWKGWRNVYVEMLSHLALKRDNA